MQLMMLYVMHYMTYVLSLLINDNMYLQYTCALLNIYLYVFMKIQLKITHSLLFYRLHISSLHARP